MKALSIVAAAILMSATGAMAEEPDTEAKKEKKVCRSEKMTGSLTRVKRTCMTQAQWDQLSHETKLDIDDMQRNGGSIPRTAGGNGSTAGSS